MKTTFIALAVLAGMGMAFAQGAGPRGGGGALNRQGQRQGQALGAKFLELQQEAIAKLDLTPQQRQKVRVLLAETRKKVQELRASKLEPQATRDKRREIMTGFRKDLMGIFTPEQERKFTELMKEARQKAGEAAAGQAQARQRVAAGQLLKLQERALDKLGLTDEQKKRAQALTSKTREKLEAVQKDTEVRQRRQKVAEIAKKHREDLDKILTPEQRRKLDELIRESRPGLRNRPPKP